MHSTASTSHPSTQLPCPCPSGSLKFRSKYIWSSSQDQLLRDLVMIHGPRSWKTICSHIPNRTSKQCRERYMNHLQEGIVKTQWSEQEEWVLYLGVQAYGKKWSKISEMLVGRTDNASKNHWNCKMRKSFKKLQKRLRSVLEEVEKDGDQEWVRKSTSSNIEIFLIRQIIENAQRVIREENRDVGSKELSKLDLVLEEYFEIYGQTKSDEQSIGNWEKELEVKRLINGRDKETIFLEDIDYLD